jgi:hypothetical protein
MRPDDTTRTIPLTKGYSATIDADDYEFVSSWKWCARVHGRTVYAARASRYCGRHHIVYLHRMLMLPGHDEQVDHISGDGLDNRRCNLRIASNAQNQHNRTRTFGCSRYKGVYWYKRYGCWRAQIKSEQFGRFLGYYRDEVDAALAYDLAAIATFGPYAALNFLRVDPATPYNGTYWGVGFPD